MVAVTLGIVLTTLIRPGDYLDTNLIETTVSIEDSQGISSRDPLNWRTLPTSLSNILPENPIDAIVNKDLFQVVIFSIILGLATMIQSLFFGGSGRYKPYVCRW